MPTMPYWMNKTREMVAMDRWFSGPDLVTRYTDAINRVTASQLANRLPSSSDVLDNELPGKQSGAFAHFGSDWLNPKNPSSGGSFWPHVPTFTIISWFQIGVLHAARKGLGMDRAHRPRRRPHRHLPARDGVEWHGDKRSSRVFSRSSPRGCAPRRPARERSRSTRCGARPRSR